jgi:hypothetical protein
MRADAAVWILVGCLLLACTREPNYAQEPGFCELPPVGYNQQISTAASGLPAYYRLSHVSPGNFEAIVNVEFPPGEPIAQRAEQCLAHASGFLTGPEGETLKLRFATPAELSRSLWKARVRVNSEGFERGHLYLWQSYWGCPEIVHEVFHFLGLVDEYAEPTPFECRSQGPEDSLLANPQAAYFALFQLGTRRSLLYPAQFRAVLYPGCRSQNEVYLDCATNAYRRPELGRGPRCFSRPSQCSAGSTEWIRL